MNTKRLFQRALPGLLAVLVIGCGESAAKLPAVKIDTQSSDTLVIYQPILIPQRNGYVIEGSVSETNSLAIRLNDHVHVEVLDESLKVIQTAYTDYKTSRRGIAGTYPTQTGTYRTYLLGELPDTATVRISAASDAHTFGEIQD